MTRPDIEAIERNLPKIFDVENKIKLTDKQLPAVKDWKVGEDYKLTEVKITELASRELEDGTIEADFEVTSVKAA